MSSVLASTKVAVRASSPAAAAAAAPAVPSLKVDTSHKDPNSLPTNTSSGGHTPESQDANKSAKPPSSTLPRPGLNDAPGLLRRQSSMSGRKRVIWKGKTCVICPPYNDERGNGVDQPRLLSSEDRAKQLKWWEDQGYDTRGFGFGTSPDTGDGHTSHGQSRPIHPAAEEMRDQWLAKEYRISIPDLQEWQAYVTRLKEERLQALGVTMGKEPKSGKTSPSVAAMSRQASSRYPHLPVSPPPPPLTASPASNQSGLPSNPFSPPLLPGAAIATGMPGGPFSALDPLSAGVAALPTTAQFGYFGPQPGASIADMLHSPPLPQGLWQTLHPPLAYQGASPGGPANLPPLAPMLHRTTSLDQTMAGALAQTASTDAIERDPAATATATGHVKVAPPLRPRPQRVHSDMLWDRKPRMGFPRHALDGQENVPPTASTGLHLSKSNSDLQLKLHNAEYHLEASIERQMAEGDEARIDDASPFDSEDVVPDYPDIPPRVNIRREPPRRVPMPAADAEYGFSGQNPPLHSPQPRARPHVLSNSLSRLGEMESRAEDALKPNNIIWAADGATAVGAGNAGDDDRDSHVASPATNASAPVDAPKTPSLLDSPIEGNASLPGPVQPTPSTSQVPKRTKPASGGFHLNVEAKEFKFDASRALTRNALPFNGALSRAGMPASGAAVASLQQVPEARRSNAAAPPLSTSGTKLNVQAAAFKPRDMSEATVPTTDFSFSSTRQPVWPIWPNGPALASTDQRQATSESVSPEGGITKPVSGPKGQSKIFDLTRPSVPSARSRAIPIVSPTDQSRFERSDDGEEEEESGRITRGQGWYKKQRRTGEDVADAPQFASRSQAQEGSGQMDEPPATNASRDEQATKADAPSGDTATLRRDSVTRDSVCNGSDPSKAVEHDLESQHKTSESAESYTTALTALTAHVNQANAEVDGSIGEQAVLQSPPEATRTAESDAPSCSTEAKNERPSSDDGPAIGVAAAPIPAAPEAEPGAIETPPPARQPDGQVKDTASGKMKPLTLVTKQARDVPPGTERSTSNRGVGSRMSWPLAGGSRPAMNLHRGTSSDGNGGAGAPADKSGSDKQGDHSRTPSQQYNPSRASTQSLDRSSPSQEKRSDVSSRGHGPSPSSPSSQRGSRSSARPRSRISPIFRRRHTSDMSIVRDPDATARHRPTASETVPPFASRELLSPSKELKDQSASQFFEGSYDHLLQRLLDHRLEPLERALLSLQESIATVAENTSVERQHRQDLSTIKSNSDADDEDEEPSSANPVRARSPRRDSKIEKFKAVLSEGLEAHAAAVQALHPVSELSAIHQALLNIQASAGREPKQDALDPKTLTSMIEATLAKSLPIHFKALSQSNSVNLKESQQLVAALDRVVGKAEQNSKVQIHMRTATEDEINELQKSRRLAGVEAARQRVLAEEKDQQLQALEEKHRRSVSELETRLKEAESKLDKATTESSSANAILREQLKGARIEVSRQRDVADRSELERLEMERTVEELKDKLESGENVRQGLQKRCDHAEEQLARTLALAEAEHAMLGEKDERLAALEKSTSEQLQAEASVRALLEHEVQRLERDQREAVKVQVKSEQLQHACESAEKMIETLRLENLDLQRANARFQGELDEAHEAGRAEVQRMKLLKEAEMEAARRQAELTRAELESELARARMDVEYHKLEYESAATRSQIQLEEVEAARTEALKSAAKAKESSLQEQREQYERRMEDLRLRHDSALQIAAADKRRSEAHIQDRLKLAEATAKHLQERVNLSESGSEHLHERITLLEEKLEIARSAAKAAAEAAQQAKTTSGAAGSSGVDSSLKVSPQALRESILVLQDQLQERESRIEALEQELAEVDREAPSKIKEQQIEIGWLRELLELRVTDLEVIIQCLASAEFDREAVQDAVIRLKANLEMEQQERERAMSMSGRRTTLSASLANVSSSLSTPKATATAAALPLAAAWGSWRKGRRESSPAEGQTPSKASPSAGRGGLFAGLLTPPGTQTRPGSVKKAVAPTSSSTEDDGVDAAAAATAAMPSTPPPTMPSMLRRDEYDDDARSNHMSVEDDEQGSSSSKHPSEADRVVEEEVGAQRSEPDESRIRD